MRHEQNTNAEPKAIALVYDEERPPHVVAKGEGDVASEIIRIAQENDVPLYENADLIEALSHLELGDEIPEVLYRIVAEVIAFAFYIKGKTPAGFSSEEKPV
jgi:flagellar biosynthesis protein